MSRLESRARSVTRRDPERLVLLSIAICHRMNCKGPTTGLGPTDLFILLDPEYNSGEFGSLYWFCILHMVVKRRYFVP